MRRAAAVVLVAFGMSACGGDNGASSEFEPREVRRTTVRPTAEVETGGYGNRFLSAGQAFEVIQYEVPELPCVRSDTTDYLHVPEASTVPGEPAVFAVVPPADSSKPVMIAFHGNGLDFIERAASLFAHAAPEVAQQLLLGDDGLVGYVEIDSQSGARGGLRGELNSAHVGLALERGWGVVIPGNCWGDGGHGEGEVVDFHVRAPRYGHTFDRLVWDWYRSQFRHDERREYSFGCSGGGQRTAQLLLHDPEAVTASGLDSPADYLPGFETEPPALFSLMSRVPGVDEVFEEFFVGHYGSRAGAEEQSLGIQLAERGITTPIYLAYSDHDVFVTSAISAPLVAALQQRLPAERNFVWNTTEPVHCQINTRDRADEVLDWLEQWRRED